MTTGDQVWPYECEKLGWWTKETRAGDQRAVKAASWTVRLLTTAVYAIETTCGRRGSAASS